MYREGFIDPTAAIVGSSSPPVLSSSEFEIDLNDSMIDEDEHDHRLGKPEEMTVQLVLCFLQLALHLCMLQESTGFEEVRPRVERKRAAIRVSGTHNIVAEDEGGNCRVDWQAHGWVMGRPYLAILEAKSAFKYIHIDERTADRKPVVSNETLGQYLGEEVVSWGANRGLLGEE